MVLPESKDSRASATPAAEASSLKLQLRWLRSQMGWKGSDLSLCLGPQAHQEYKTSEDPENTGLVKKHPLATHLPLQFSHIHSHASCIAIPHHTDPGEKTKSTGEQHWHWANLIPASPSIQLVLPEVHWAVTALSFSVSVPIRKKRTFPTGEVLWSYREQL